MFNRKIIVRSGSISLSFMNRCKLTSLRISRYIHEIMANDITIEYIKGSNNTFADILCCIPRHNCIQSIDARERNEVTIMKLKFDGSLNLSSKFKRIKELQERDPILSEIMKKAPKVEEAGESKVAISDDLLYKLEGIDVIKWKIYVPASIEEEIIMAIHRGMGHSGVERVSLTIRENMYIKHLAKKTRKLIANCVLCQKAKPMNIIYDTDPQAILRREPNDLIAVDMHGPMPISTFGYRYIFIVYEVFSKFTSLYPYFWFTRPIFLLNYKSFR